jgi:hypothetical protein
MRWRRRSPPCYEVPGYVLAALWYARQHPVPPRRGWWARAWAWLRGRAT